MVRAHAGEFLFCIRRGHGGEELIFDFWLDIAECGLNACRCLARMLVRPCYNKSVCTLLFLPNAEHSQSASDLFT